jgi:hypothetical protein
VPTLGDIVRGEGAEYLQTHSVARVQRKALRDIAQCRTAALGWTPARCDDCEDEYRLFCSCGNRSCPLCGGEARAKWIEAREKELLPVPYLQIVFSVPRVLYVLARYCPKVFYDAVMRAAGQAVIDVGWSELRIRLGCYLQFHTWTQKMLEYLHAHCAVPAGGFSEDGRWVPFEPQDLPVKALRKRFGTLLCRALEDAAREGKFEGLPPQVRIEQLIVRAKARRWKVYAKPPFGGPEGLVQYLARYMYRVAITNERIESYENHRVTFWCRKSACGNEETLCTLDGQVFLERFLIHVPPKGFVRSRSFGLLGNRNRKQKGERAVQLIGRAKKPPSRAPFKPLRLCPACAYKRGIRKTHFAPGPDVQPQLDLPLRPPPSEPIAA